MQGMQLSLLAFVRDSETVSRVERLYSKKKKKKKERKKQKKQNRESFRYAPSGHYLQREAGDWLAGCGISHMIGLGEHICLFLVGSKLKREEQKLGSPLIFDQIVKVWGQVIWELWLGFLNWLLLRLQVKVLLLH